MPEVHISPTWLLGLILFATGACTPPVRAAGSPTPTGEAATGGVSKTAAAAPAEEQSPRPPPATPSSLPPAKRGELKGGSSFCTVGRPDLHRAFVSLRVERTTARPEELYLLRRFIQEAWQREMPAVQAEFLPEPCSDAFVCAAVRPDDWKSASAALARALSSPPAGAFYAVRVSALGTAEDWDRTSAEWKLQTYAHLLANGDPPITALLGATPPTSGAQWTTFFEKKAGSRFMSSTPLYVLEKQLRSLRAGARLTLVGPGDPSAALRSFSDNDKPLPEDVLTEARKRAAVRTSPLSGPHPSAPLVFEEDAGHRTHARLVWAWAPSARSQAVEIALQVLLERWKREDTSSVRVAVSPASGLFPSPSISLDGPHEQVITAISELSSRYDQIISAGAPPSKDEWEHAALHVPRAPLLDPRCTVLSRNAGLEAEHLTHAVSALRTAGAPIALVWGTDTVETTEEESPE